MKAVRMHAVGGPEVLRLDAIEAPEPGAGQILVKVEAAGVTYGDVMKRQGVFGPPPLPAGLGLEVAGTVAVLGSGVSAPAPGSRVMAWVDHGYAEYALAPAAAVVALPVTVDLDVAAVLPVQGTTAYQTLHNAGGLRAGESVLVHAAAGGVGGLAVQLARLGGAHTVLGTASQPRKLDHVRHLGALAIDYTSHDWPTQVLDATDGRGVDLILDSVGGQVATQSLDCLAPFGRIVSFGAASGTPAAISGMSLMPDNQSLIGYSLMTWLARGGRTARVVEEIVSQVATGQLEVPLAPRLSLNDAQEAHRAIDQRQTIGTTVLVP